MTYDSQEAAWDQAYERLSEELYPEHREQAIVEYTDERLRSYYLAHPSILVPAMANYRHAKSLLASGFHPAALVFAASATELFLKESLLRPVVFGLVHSPSLAQLVVDSAMSQTGFTRGRQAAAARRGILYTDHTKSSASSGSLDLGGQLNGGGSRIRRSLSSDSCAGT